MNSYPAFALEFGESPRIQSLNPKGALPPRSESFLIAPGGSSAMTVMLRTCRALQAQFEERGQIWDDLQKFGSVATSVNLSPGAHILKEGSRSSYVKQLKIVVLKSYEEVEKLAEEGALWNKPEMCTYLYASQLTDSRNAFRESVRVSELRAAVDFLSSLTSQLEDSNSIEEPLKQETSPSKGISLARRRRDEILAEGDWLTAEEVHDAQGGVADAKGVNNAASRLRKSGRLLGVWNGRAFLHPAFQYRADTGTLMPEMAELLKVLPDDDTGWRQAFWLFQRHAQLPGSQRPADVFQHNPAAVLNAAKSDFQVSDSSW